MAVYRYVVELAQFRFNGAAKLAVRAYEDVNGSSARAVDGLESTTIGQKFHVARLEVMGGRYRGNEIEPEYSSCYDASASSDDSKRL